MPGESSYGSVGSLAPEARPQPARRALWPVALASLVLVVGGLRRARGPSAAAAAAAPASLEATPAERRRRQHRREERDALSDDGDDEWSFSAFSYSYEVVLTYEDFLDDSKVTAFLEEVGVDYAAMLDATGGVTDDELFHYVPRELRVQMVRPDLAKGEIGDDAMEGYVAFDAAYTFDSDIAASYLIVVDYYGRLKTVAPTYRGSMMYRVGGLKPVNATHFLLAAGEKAALTGPRFLWDWREDEWTSLCDGATNDVHDIQFAKGSYAIWQMSNDEQIKRWDAHTGEILTKFSVPHGDDVNHCQLVEDDGVAFVSSRLTNGLVKMNATTGDRIWVLGGEYGDFELEDFDGTVHAAGAALWVGQHNLEYFGEDEYFMLDNQYDTGNNSRMLIVKVESEGATKRARLDWQKTFEGYSPHFGDADLLPTGNVFGCYWPDAVKSSWDVQYDERAYEVARDDDATLVWMLSLSGKQCEETVCARSDSSGWSFYSIERFYTAPLVYRVTCSGTSISFSTQNNFKQSDQYRGKYDLVDADSGDALASGDFYWAAYWRETSVEISLDSLPTDRVRLLVTNQFGDTTRKAFSC